MTGFKVLQWNLGKRFLATSELDQKDAIVHMIQEQYIGGKVPVANKRGWFSHSQNARAAIYVNSNAVVATKLSQYCNRDICTVEVLINRDSFIFCSVYADGQINCLPNELDDLIAFCRRKKKRLCLGLDGNGSGYMWYSDKENARGRMLEDYIIHHGLQVENEGSEPTFCRWAYGKNCTSIIDLTLSLNMEGLIKRWHVEKDTLSDHRPIRMEIEGSKVEPICGRIWSKANWGKIRSYIEEAMQDIVWCNYWSEKLLQDRVNWIERIFMEALNVGCPIIRREKIIKPLFWNDGCHAARKTFRRIQRREHRRGRPTEAGWMIIKDAQREYNRTISRCKREAWQSFTSKVSDYKGMAKLCRIIKGKQSMEPCSIRRDDGTICEGAKESQLELLKEFFPGSREKTRVCRPTESFHYCPDIEWINLTRIRRAIAHFKPFKIGGVSEIKPIFLKNLPTCALQLLRQIYNASLNLRFTPDCWRRSKVVFIGKNGRADASSKRSYRPLSMSDFTYKINELLIMYHLEETVLKLNPPHRYQYAFRKGRSSEHAISRTTALIERGLLNKQYTLCVFADIRSAFDRILPAKIIESLRKKGASDMICSWYSQYLENRTVVARIGEGEEIEMEHLIGVQQGSQLSPQIGFQPSMDILLERIEQSRAAGTGYADDLSLVASGICLRTVTEAMQEGLNICETWGNEFGLEFCPSKTVVLLITRKRGADPLPLFLNGTQLSYVRDARYLGININDRLNWKPHIEQQIRKAKGLIARGKKLIREKYGPRPKYHLYLWSGIIQPMLFYGAAVWAMAARQKGIKSALERTQSLALRMVASVRRGTPTAALQIMYGQMPIDVAIEKNALRQWCRIREIETDDRLKPIGGHRHFLDREMPCSIGGRKSDSCPPFQIWEKGYEVEVGEGEEPQLEYDTWYVYTDGSLSGERGGAGSVIYKNGKKVASLGWPLLGATSFQMELEAIIKSAEYMRERARGQTVIFLTDSQAALTCLAKNICNTNTQLRAVVSLGGIDGRVKLCWIRSGAGRGNKQADLAANAAAREEGGKFLNLSQLEIKICLQDRAVAKWSDRWSKLNTCRQSKIFWSSPDIQNSKLLLSFSREKASFAVRLWTGHGFFRRHRQICGEETTADCRLCSAGEETPEHLILKCNALASHRIELFGKSELGRKEIGPMQALCFAETAGLSALEEEERREGQNPD